MSLTLGSALHHCHHCVLGTFFKSRKLDGAETNHTELSNAICGPRFRNKDVFFSCAVKQICCHLSNFTENGSR